MPRHAEEGGSATGGQNNPATNAGPAVAEEEGSSLTPWLVGAALLVVLAAGGVLMARKANSRTDYERTGSIAYQRRRPGQGDRRPAATPGQESPTSTKPATTSTKASVAGRANSPPVRDRVWVARNAVGAVTSRVVSANSVPPTTCTRRVWRPGVVPRGMVATMRNRPEASAVVVPSRTGSLKRSTDSGLPAGNPPPVSVTLSPGAA